LGANEKQGSAMLVSGVIVGALSYGFVTPVFQMKTRLQAQMQQPQNNRPHRNFVHGLLNIWRAEGAAATYRGMVPLMIRGSCFRAGSFVGYDVTKTHCKERGILPDGPALHLIASVTSSFLATLLSAPADYVMSVWATAPLRGIKYRNLSHCMSDIVKHRGYIALFTGWHSNFLRVAPIMALNFPLYEQARRLLGIGYLD
jgi:hypothetical protein